MELAWRADQCLGVYRTMMRHAFAYRDGQDATTDTLVSELGAVMANCAILLDAAQHGTLVDDRPEK
jgi:hypothetical protein